MKKRIPLGLQSYDKLKTGNYYVVDKSLMIQDFLLRGNEVTLITRPRRFGKTIILCPRYYSKRRKKEDRDNGR